MCCVLSVNMNIFFTYNTTTRDNNPSKMDRTTKGYVFFVFKWPLRLT